MIELVGLAPDLCSRVVRQEAEVLAHPSQKELGMLSPKKKKEGGGGLIPPLGGNPGKKRQTVEQELHIVKTRYLPTPKRAGSPSRLSRLRPETRGWTPVSEPLSLSHTLIEPILCQAPGARLPTARSVTVAASKHRPVRFIFALPAPVCVT